VSTRLILKIRRGFGNQQGSSSTAGLPLQDEYSLLLPPLASEGTAQGVRRADGGKDSQSKEIFYQRGWGAAQLMQKPSVSWFSGRRGEGRREERGESQLTIERQGLGGSVRER